MALDSFVIVPPDDPRWQAAFDRLPIERQDVFWSSAYARLMQETIYREHDVLCAIGEPGPLLDVFALRSLDKMVGPVARGLDDVTGLYGRSGLIGANGENGAEFLRRFEGTFPNVLCGLDRAHPVWEIDDDASGQLRDVGAFVVLDLSPPIEEIEAAYAHSLRKEIAKAERNGVGTTMTRGAVSSFDRIYDETMDRRLAERFYRFNGYFFERAEALLGDLAITMFVKDGGGLFVSCELVLVHGLYAHSFLGGTTDEGLRLSANHILKRDLIRELKRRGCRYYLLGGGHSPGDGIEKYKRQFAPNGIYPSRIGCRVFDQARYDKLKADMIDAGMPIRDDRFQFYDPS